VISNLLDSIGDNNNSIITELYLFMFIAHADMKIDISELTNLGFIHIKEMMEKPGGCLQLRLF